MSIVSALILILSGIVNALGSALIKYATDYRKGSHPDMLLYYAIIALAMLLFGGGFPLYMVGLSRAKLSVAQPVFSATTYLSTMLIAFLFFRETLSLLQLMGLAAIMGGIVLVATG